MKKTILCSERILKLVSCTFGLIPYSFVFQTASLLLACSFVAALKATSSPPARVMGRKKLLFSCSAHYFGLLALLPLFAHVPSCSVCVCAPGPVEETKADFWRMVWEQHSSTIVMLTNLEENGKVSMLPEAFQSYEHIEQLMCFLCFSRGVCIF